LYRIGAQKFEDLVQNRIKAMGFETQRVGKTFAKDGGVDMLFWREDAPFPFLGALQAKYHSSSDKKTGGPDVRDFVGTLRYLPVAVGVLVTNTTFTFDAGWVASRLTSQIRLRDQQDLRRWISGRFVDALEWREIPAEIELCPGVRIPIPKKRAKKP
jgi:restriction endonuclease Mrr